ncbi:MAG: hypothetical protein VB036_17320 [Propionicimonas sp.]|nr:hypothetical protein [Propionicimonas sp.]
MSRSHLDPARLLAVAGTVLVVGYAALAGLQILVLNPLAAVPGRSLGQINADLAAQHDSLGMPVVVSILGLGVVGGLALLMRFWRDPQAEPRSVVLGYLGLLTLGAPASFFAGFGAGMALADTYGINAGDYSPWSAPLYATSLVALLGIPVVRWVGSRRRLQHPVATSG